MTTWKDITRSTEDESKKFREALKKLSFTREEFIQYGPAIIRMKYEECMKEMGIEKEKE